MRVILWAVCCALIMGFVMMGNGSAEYYQYTDEEGNVHFTDNIAEVPENKRSGVKSFESVNTSPVSKPSDRSTPSASAKMPETSSQTWDQEVSKTYETLDRQKAQLDKTYQELKQEKQRLSEKSPATMSPEERTAYRQSVEELNDRIEQYQKKESEFQKRVDQFNSRIKKRLNEK